MSDWVNSHLVMAPPDEGDRFPRFQLDSWQRAVLATIYPSAITAAAAAEEEQARRRVLEQ